MLVVLTSAKGSPGVTTAGLVLAGLSGGVLVECDPAGADVRCWSAAVQGEGAGLVELVHRLRAGEPDPDELVGAWADEPWPGIRVVTGPPSAPMAQNTLAAGTERLAAALAAARRPVLVDIGRWSTTPGVAPLVRAAAAVAVVVRPTVDGVAHARGLIAALDPVAVAVWLLLVGDRPYRAADVADALQVPLWGALALDAAGVAVLMADGVAGRRWPRTELARSAVPLINVFAGDEETTAVATTDRPGPELGARGRG